MNGKLPRPAKSWKGCCRWSGPLGRAFGQPPVVPALRSGGCPPLCRCWELGRGSAPGGIEGREGSIPACEEAGITDLTAVGPKAPALPQPRPGVPPSQAQHQGPCPLPLPQGCDGATHLEPPTCSRAFPLRGLRTHAWGWLETVCASLVSGMGGLRPTSLSGSGVKIRLASSNELGTVCFSSVF